MQRTDTDDYDDTFYIFLLIAVESECWPNQWQWINDVIKNPHSPLESNLPSARHCWGCWRGCQSAGVQRQTGGQWWRWGGRRSRAGVPGVVTIACITLSRALQFYIDTVMYTVMYRCIQSWELVSKLCTEETHIGFGADWSVHSLVQIFGPDQCILAINSEFSQHSYSDVVNAPIHL